MDLSAPHSALVSDCVGALLSTLTGTTRPLSGRELARLSGCPHTTARRTLQQLAEHGLVNVQEAGAGAALLYTLNREHVAADAVHVLTSLRRRLVERLRTELEAWRIRPWHASLFGSAARGDGDTSSDIDIFIARPADREAEDREWREQVERLPELILGWTGNHAGIVEVSREEVGRLVRDEAPIIDELMRDAIVLTGAPVAHFAEEATT